MDHGRSTPGAAEAAKALLPRWRQLTRQGVDAMRARGLIDPALDASQAAAVFIAGIQGSVQMLRSTGDSSHCAAVIDILIDYLMGRGVRSH